MTDALDRPRRPKRRRVPQETADGRCRFEHSGARCPFPAVWGDNPYAPTRWCHWHAEADHRGHGQEQDVFFADHCQTRQQVLDTHKRWYGESHEERLQRHIAEHPEWQRGEHETASEYVARMRQICRELARGAIKRVPATTDEEEVIEWPA